MNSSNDAPDARPATPIPASTLLALARAKSDVQRGIKRKRIGVGCRILDDQLQGGLGYGEISLISGESAVGKSSVSTFQSELHHGVAIVGRVR